MALVDRSLRWVANNASAALGGGIAFLVACVFAFLQVAPYLRWVVVAVAVVVLSFVGYSIRYAKKHALAYYRIVLTWDENYKDSAVTASGRFFSRLRIPKSGPKELVRVSALGQDNWQELVDLAVARLNESLERHNVIHLACNAYWMWCFAFGTHIQDRLRLVLYHFQDGTYYRIWEMSRDIKNRKAITSGRYLYRACKPPERIRQGHSTEEVGLVFACGSHDPCGAVLEFVQAQLPDVPIWAVRIEGGIDPQYPMRWIDAASDLANAVDEISQGGSKTLYVFGTAPDTLGLMVGSAVGPYRRAHLMQYQNGTYHKEMTLQPKP